MADGGLMSDLDDLLDSAEKLTSKYPTSKRPPVVSNSRDVEVDRLLEVTEDSKDGQMLRGFKLAGSQAVSSSPAGQQPKKCILGPRLGGSGAPAGVYAPPLHARCCDRLLCVDCDLRVIWTDDHEWKADTADYLFLRNNYPDLWRLRPALSARSGSRAYACQCRAITVRGADGLVAASDVAEFADGGGGGGGGRKLRWICDGRH